MKNTKRIIAAIVAVLLVILMIMTSVVSASADGNMNEHSSIQFVTPADYSPGYESLEEREAMADSPFFDVAPEGYIIDLYDTVGWFINGRTDGGATSIGWLQHYSDFDGSEIILFLRNIGTNEVTPLYLSKANGFSFSLPKEEGLYSIFANDIAWETASGDIYCFMSNEELPFYVGDNWLAFRDKYMPNYEESDWNYQLEVGRCALAIPYNDYAWNLTDISADLYNGAMYKVTTAEDGTYTDIIYEEWNENTFFPGNVKNIDTIIKYGTSYTVSSEDLVYSRTWKTAGKYFIGGWLEKENETETTKAVSDGTDSADVQTKAVEKDTEDDTEIKESLSFVEIIKKIFLDNIIVWILFIGIFIAYMIVRKKNENKRIEENEIAKNDDSAIE